MKAVPPEIKGYVTEKACCCHAGECHRVLRVRGERVSQRATVEAPDYLPMRSLDLSYIPDHSMWAGSNPCPRAPINSLGSGQRPGK